MMYSEKAHIIGIPKHEHYYNAWFTEFIINLQGSQNPDITCKQFRKILNEMRSCHVGEPFSEMVDDSTLFYNIQYDRKILEDWVRQKCCWADKQYIIDEAFTGFIHDGYPSIRYVFITLRKILYVEQAHELRLMIPKPLKNIIAREIPEH